MATAEITMELGRPRSRRRRWLVAMTVAVVAFVAGAYAFQRLVLTTPTAEARPASAFSAGPFHTCAVQQATVVCWGNNDHGQLGLRGVSSSARPIVVPGLHDATQVSAGYQHSCALRRGGAVACWGSGITGSLGNGRRSDSAVPVSVMGLRDAISVSAGDSRSCAIRASRHVVCWGLGVFGPSGGDESDASRASSLPVAIKGLDDVSAISVGQFSACALRVEGDVRCWGGDTQGELGDGAHAESATPVQVKGIDHATQITIGELFACALQSGQVLCWGDNDRGDLGDGTNRDSSTPVVVEGLHDVTAISGTCALRATRAVVCWGDNYGGVLNTRRIEDSLSPIPIRGLDDVYAISSGGIHACAVLENGSMACWGDNTYRELGDGVPLADATGTVI